jgi:hypothetical protein
VFWENEDSFYYFKVCIFKNCKEVGWREVSGILKELMPNFKQKKRHFDKVSFFCFAEEAGLEPANCLIQNQEPYQFGHSSIVR